MNKVILMGRLTRDPEVRYSQGEKPVAVARYTLAVNRAYKRDGEPDADFINCVVFGRSAEFAEKYFRQGTRIVISGRIQTGSYVNKDNVRVYTTDIIVEEQEFAESKRASGQSAESTNGSRAADGNVNYDNGSSSDGFMNVPPGLDEELPFT